MFGLGILKGTIIGLGIGVIASFALKEACKNSNKNKENKFKIIEFNPLDRCEEICSFKFNNSSFL